MKIEEKKLQDQLTSGRSTSARAASVVSTSVNPIAGGLAARMREREAKGREREREIVAMVVMACERESIGGGGREFFIF
tara:strand:- start:529 stop:765 length:237 start_codon:yes stop_codon:yes gene_type:complete